MDRPCILSDGVILNGLQTVEDLARSLTAPARVKSDPRKMLRKHEDRISLEKRLRFVHAVAL